MHRSILKLWNLYNEAQAELDSLADAPGAGADDPAALEEAQRSVRQLKDRLVVNYSPLVKYAAGRVSARTTGSLEQSDLISWGIVGLLEAVETFDAGKGAKFETYAISKIRWAILDEMRRMDPLPRRMRQRSREVQKARELLEQDLARVPTEREVADHLGVAYEDHREFLKRYSQSQSWSLEASLETGEDAGWGLHNVIADSASETPAEALEEGELRERLIEAIRNLGERERVVTTFYYYEGLTLREIGKALNLTEGRISQILRQATGKLRIALSEKSLSSGR